MVVDGLVRHFTRGRSAYDRDAQMAARGRLLPALLDDLLADPYFRRPPPKTAGREQYGEPYLRQDPRLGPRAIAHSPPIWCAPPPSSPRSRSWMRFTAGCCRGRASRNSSWPAAARAIR